MVTVGFRDKLNYLKTGEKEQTMAKAKKFGAFGGVFTPSILTILGVIMYLRLPWIVGQAGLLATLGIIIVAHIISASTGLSVASIATDKKVESGGTYYIISRSLGLPIGGTLGWALFVGLSFSVSLYLIGFAEVFLGYFGFEVTLNNIRIAGVIILLVITILTFISTSLAIKTQYLILTAMVLSLVSVFLGNHSFEPSALQTDVLPGSLPWIALFAIFFPAVTGFEAGVSMSGDLKDPKKAIPAGTISAILVGLVTYVGLAYYFSATVDRAVLVNDPNVLFNISWLPQLVIAGILGATFSSALGSILSAPRILQAVAKDRIAPRFFSKGHGPSNEPRNAILLTFVIALGGILIGELNVIARIVTTFFIITYGFLNITYTVESWASSDFRPSFRIPRFVSIVGAIASIVVMIQLDILAMIAASVILLGLFLVLRRQELNLQTGDTWNSVWMSLVKYGLKKLTRNEIHHRNWRPNIILMSGGATTRPHLIEMALSLIGHQGVFTNFELEEASDQTVNPGERVRMEKLNDYPEIITRKYGCSSIYEGIDMISRVYGFSGFEPDTILMGWPKATADPSKMNQLLDTLQKRDFNLALLDYDNERGFGNYTSIDFWWTGSGRELTLAMHLLRFISSKKEWRKARLRLLVLNDDTTLTERYYSILKQMTEDYRLNAEIKVVLNPDKHSGTELIGAESESTGLTILTLPEFNDEQSVDFIKTAGKLSSGLHSCLWIRASGRFEAVDVLSESERKLPELAGLYFEEKVSGSLDTSAAGRDSGELMEFALQGDLAMEMLDKELFKVLEHRRSAVVESLFAQYLQPEKWLRLIEKQLKEELIFEEELVSRVISDYLTTVRTSVNLLLKQLHLKPGRKDSRSMDVAVKYYLLSRRVDSVEHFYTGLMLRTVQFNITIREFLIHKQSDSNAQIAATELISQTQSHLRELFLKMVADFRQDILLLSQLMEGPKLNEMYSNLRKLNLKKEAQFSELEEAPGRIRGFLQLQWNKTTLDGLCLSVREKMENANEQLFEGIHSVLTDSLYKSLYVLADRLTDPTKANIPDHSVSDMPVFEKYFFNLNSHLREIVSAVPELLTVSGNSLPETLSLETLEDQPEFEINVRTTVDYYLSNEFVDKINKQSAHLTKEVRRIYMAIGNIAKLAGYHQSQYQSNPEINKKVFDDLKLNLQKEKERLEKVEQDFRTEMETGLIKSFEALNATEIVNAAGSPGARIVNRHQHNKTRKKLFLLLENYRKLLVQSVVELFYKQSKGVLWTKRQELIKERSSLYPGDRLKRFVEIHSPDQRILVQLPYYYVNLFTDDAGASPEFRVVMKEETQRGEKAFSRFRDGHHGLVVITGDSGSGKTSLARYLAESHFNKNDIWRLRAPLECSADLSSFETQLKELAGGKGSLERRLDLLSDKKVLIIDDLELWWERRQNGAVVVKRVLELVKQYGSHLFVVVTINRHALHILEQLTQLNAWVSELIYCQPFDARELKEMILERHQAGGLNFILENKEEEEFTNWSYARYFNQLFNCCGGNPGIAMQYWMSGIRAVEGMRIIIGRPKQEVINAGELLTDREWLVVLQLVFHRKMSIERISQLLNWNVETVGVTVRRLVRYGVLNETSAGVYVIQPVLEPILITNLKTVSYL